MAARRSSAEAAQRPVERHLVGVDEELADHGVGEVTVGLLDEYGVEELPLVPQHCEVILGTR